MGSIFTASDAAKWMEEQNRTSEGYRSWRQMYGAVDLAKQRSINQATLSTEEGMSEAYAEAFAAKQAVDKSNYFDTYKQQLDKGIASSLEDAYASYLQNYGEQVQKIENTARERIGAITEARDVEAEKYAALGDKPYEYLRYLYDTYYADEDMRNKLKEQGFDWDESELWSRYLKDEVDEEGNVTGRVLRSWDELANIGDEDVISPFFDKDAQGNRTLSTMGVEFFDMMLNNPLYSKGVTSFDEWLRTNDSELFDWYATENPYSYVPGTENKGGNLFRQFVGMRSDDMEYKFIERAGGMSEKQINNMIGSFTTKLEQLGEDYHSDYSDIKEGSVEALNEVRTLMKDLGLSEEINDYFKEQGVTWDSVAEDINKIANEVKTKGELTQDFFSGLSIGAILGGGTFAGISAGTAVGAGAALAGASAATGGIAALVAGAVALVAGSAIGGSNVVKGRKQSEYAAEQTKKQVLNYISNVTAYAQALRAHTQEGKAMNFEYQGYNMPTFDEWKASKKSPSVEGEPANRYQELIDIAKENAQAGRFGVDPRREVRKKNQDPSKRRR